MRKITAVIKAIKNGPVPLWLKRRVFVANEERIAGLDAELAVLTNADCRDSREHRRADTRRKLLAGQAVARRLERRPGLAGLLRKLLGPVLHRAQQRRLFDLEGDGPLIPTVLVSKRPVAGTTRRADRMSPEERKTRIEEIKRERAELLDQRRELQAADRDSETPADPTLHRFIVLGGAFLSLARGRPWVTTWLRRLLDDYLTGKRDRALFSFESGPLVVGESEARRTGRRPARASAKKPKTRAGDPGPEAARRVTDVGTSDGSRAPAGGGAQAAGASPKRAEHATAGNVEQVWKPCRLPAASTSSAAGTGKQDWGARLDGVRAVAGLPEELVGTMITIETSGGKSWEEKVTEVVSRDNKCVVVRRSGAPRKRGMEG